MEINPVNPFRPEEPEKPSDSKEEQSPKMGLDQKIEMVKDALSDLLKRHQKMVSEILQNAAQELENDPEDQDNILAQANAKIQAKTDDFFKNLPPAAYLQLQEIGGDDTDQIVSSMKQEMQASNQAEGLVGRSAPLFQTSEYSNAMDYMNQAISQKYGPEASVQNIGSFSTELLALIEAFKKAPNALDADAIFSQIQIVLGGSSGTAPTTAPSDSSAINAIIEQFEAQQGFSGSVMVVQNGIPIFTQGYGEASPGVANGPNTTFRLDSVGKIITATAVMQLYEKGMLNLDVPITTYLPEYSNPQTYPGFAGQPPVTIRSLLTMTSGIADLPPTNWLNHPPSVTDIANLIATEPRSGQGTWSYSNSSFNLLSMIIGRVSDPTTDPSVSYSNYLQKNIFNPAGMTTASAPSTVDEDNPDAQSHIFDANGNRVEIGTNQYPDYTSMRVGAGNINGSVGDFEKFDAALNSGKLISPQDWQMMQDQRFGGWDPGDHSINGQSFLCKSGAQDGEQSFYMRFPGTNTMIFITANISPKDPSNPESHIQYLAGEIANLLFPESYTGLRT